MKIVRSPRSLVIAFSVICLALLSIFYVLYTVFPGPELLVLGFFIIAEYKNWSPRFVRDWVPFFALFFAYEAMYGFADNVTGIVHELRGVEFQIFGMIPTLVLQQLYRSPVLDYVGAFFYSLHFIVPMVFGFMLWRFSPRNYWRYLFAFLLVSYSALLTFTIYPTAPPWFGVNATRILYQASNEMGVPIYANLFAHLESNPFAAFPSLHAAYPWLVSLYAIRIKRVKALPILIIPIAVWFSAVYLGEHYVVDVLGGIAYSTVAFFLAEKLIPLVSFDVQHAFAPNS